MATSVDGLFGTNEWYAEFYPTTQGSLLDEVGVPLKDASTDHVVTYVRARLATVFSAVSTAGVLRNSRRAPLFALVLGVANPGKSAQQAALRIGNHLVNSLSTS